MKWRGWAFPQANPILNEKTLTAHSVGIEDSEHTKEGKMKDNYSIWIILHSMERFTICIKYKIYGKKNINENKLHVNRKIISLKLWSKQKHQHNWTVNSYLGSSRG